MDDKKEKKIVVSKSDTLSGKAAESALIVKAKLKAVQEKNKILLEKCKVQASKIKEQTALLAERAMHAKPILVSKSIYQKIKEKVSRVKVFPEKRIVCFDMGDIGHLYGYVEYKRNNMIIVRDAYIVDYSLGDSEMKLTKYAGSPYICRENVLYIVDKPIKIY